jgi:hypothetical protein
MASLMASQIDRPRNFLGRSCDEHEVNSTSPFYVMKEGH